LRLNEGPNGDILRSNQKKVEVVKKIKPPIIKLSFHTYLGDIIVDLQIA